jgi:hypothetical protein
MRDPLPATYPAGASFRPPVYSGIEPSPLPAFSAPTAVKVVPSCFASSAVSLAFAPYEKNSARAAPDDIMRFMLFSDRS